MTSTPSTDWTTGTGLPLGQKYLPVSAAGLPLETTDIGYPSSPFDLPSSLGGTVAGYAASITYDAWGNVLDEQVGSGATNLADINSTYDAHTLRLKDQLVKRDATTPATSVDEETYDTTAGNTASDILGELTSQVQHSLTSAQEITTANTFGGANGGPHALTAAATTGGATANSSFHYDAAGNMTTRSVPATGTQTLAWNAAGQLTSITDGTSGTSSYVYTPDGSLLLQADGSTATLNPTTRLPA